jgi:hypothetical protein
LLSLQVKVLDPFTHCFAVSVSIVSHALCPLWTTNLSPVVNARLTFGMHSDGGAGHVLILVMRSLAVVSCAQEIKMAV